MARLAGRCPVCGADAPMQPVYKHWWIACDGCGNGSRVSRERLLADALPEAVRVRLPRSLSVDRETFADPQSLWFRTAFTHRAVFVAEADAVEARLAAHGIAVGGDVLDICGGPGDVGARLAERARRVVLLEHGRSGLRHAREVLGLDARFFDFDGSPLPEVAPGPFELLLCRFGIGFCRDLARFAAGLGAVAAPGAHLELTFIPPSRGAFLTSALEDHAPSRLWAPAFVEGVFAAAGWALERRFEPLPPMPFWVPRGARYRVFSAPWLYFPGPTPRDPLQYHAGRVFRFGGP